MVSIRKRRCSLLFLCLKTVLEVLLKPVRCRPFQASASFSKPLRVSPCLVLCLACSALLASASFSLSCPELFQASFDACVPDGGKRLPDKGIPSRIQNPMVLFRLPVIGKPRRALEFLRIETESRLKGLKSLLSGEKEKKEALSLCLAVVAVEERKKKVRQLHCSFYLSTCLSSSTFSVFTHTPELTYRVFKSLLPPFIPEFCPEKSKFYLQVCISQK